MSRLASMKPGSQRMKALIKTSLLFSVRPACIVNAACIVWLVVNAVKYLSKSVKRSRECEQPAAHSIVSYPPVSFEMNCLGCGSAKL